MAAPIADSDWLSWIEKLAGKSGHRGDRELAPQSFHCRLDDQPTHLVPKHCLRPAPIVVPARLARTCIFTSDGNLPRTLVGREALLRDFALDGPIVWVKDGRSDIPLPFWLGEAMQNLIAKLTIGQKDWRHPSTRALETLAAAGLLELESHEADHGQQLSECIARCAMQFAESGYAPISGLIHPFHTAALRRYYRFQIRSGALPLGDDQSPRRYVSHNDSVARFFHHYLTPVVRKIVGEPIRPSYVYLASYQAGAILERHTDREQCEFSVSFCLDYSPEPTRHTPWPLFLHLDRGTVTVFQRIGDGLVYRGRQIPHSRQALPAGNSSTSIFFHYVREDFTGPLD